MSADTNLRLYGSFASTPAIAPDRATLDCADPDLSVPLICNSSCAPAYLCNRFGQCTWQTTCR
jgi:hypothetical protein